MRLLILPLAILLSLSANATTNTTEPRPASSAKQLFFGEKVATNSCSSDARLLTTKEIDAIGRSTLCRDVLSKYAIWKVQGPDLEWSFTGTGYNCDMKKYVNPTAQSICVMNETAPENTAYLFPEANFESTVNWNALADIKKVGEEEPNRVVKSFTLGANTQLTAYPEPNFRGDQKIFTKTTASSAATIASNKVKQRNSLDDVVFSYTSYGLNKTCLRLEASATDLGEQTICSEDLTFSKIFTIMPDQPMRDTVSLYLTTFKDGKPDVTEVGSLHLSFTGAHTFSVTNSSLPPTLKLVVSQQIISFEYTPVQPK